MAKNIHIKLINMKTIITNEGSDNIDEDSNTIDKELENIDNESNNLDSDTINNIINSIDIDGQCNCKEILRYLISHLLHKNRINVIILIIVNVSMIQ
ncbi:5123_t:CDS:2 [Dentiscutata erythropus]|uniref:5123_t:CDS:1 n=1 Tax=Dentiscutata erythropus TaxID=1348616 RepID=A0A9N9BH80_9GLOM|nr:5123_t:CDS:2 [Dentiscutata erythropus]